MTITLLNMTERDNSPATATFRPYRRLASFRFEARLRLTAKPLNY